MKRTFLFILLSILVNCAHTTPKNQPKDCETQPELQKGKSLELIQLAKEDQIERAQSYDTTNWNKLNQRDLQRRIRVATLFAEGCFKNSSDYASAAIIYQHGTTADHFYQAFLWANIAVKLGDESQLWLTAAALDRYLIKIGQKQLFGTQFSKNHTGQWCIESVEPSFPESLRSKYVRLSVNEQIARTMKGIGTSQLPQDVKDCNSTLKPSPKGSLPGFW